MITPQSRYAQGLLARSPNSSGTFNLSVYRTVAPSNLAFRLYVWKATDRPDLVAYNLLGNATLWWAIFDINPEVLDPLRVPPGTALKIPTGPVVGQGTLIQ